MKLALAHPSPQTLSALALQLASQPGHTLCWSTSNGREISAHAGRSPVDLLLLDICFAQPSSVELVRALLEARACAVLLLADRPHAHISAVYEAMGLGALDVVRIPEPGAGEDDAAFSALHTKLLSVSKLLGRLVRPAPGGSPDQPRTQPTLIALGASTGGPQALFRILSQLPPELAATLVIAQHVDNEFTQGLADWLQQGSSMRVELAREGCRPQAGTVLLAGSNDHLALGARGSFGYTAEPRQLPYRPSIDVLFRSLAEHWAVPGVAVLLTGMGRDGAQGLKQLKGAGWHTIAQDEPSSVVFGMPKAAIGLGAADHVLPLDRIAERIVRLCRAPAPALSRRRVSPK